MHLNKKITTSKKKKKRFRPGQTWLMSRPSPTGPHTTPQPSPSEKKEKKKKQGPYGHTGLTQPNPNKKVGHTGFALNLTQAKNQSLQEPDSKPNSS